MAVTVQDIEQKEFTIVKGTGYDRREVDTFLDDIMDEMDRQAADMQKLQNELASVKARLQQAQAAAAAVPAARPVAPAPSVATDDASNRKIVEILEMATRLKEETLTKAQAEADEILSKATTEANERLQGLESEKTALETEVSNLKAAATSYRAQFEALLAAQQEALEKASNLF